MCRPCLPAVACVLAFHGPMSLANEPPAVNLARVDRSIVKEPKYQSKKPLYCLLVFGQRAESRVWLVFDLAEDFRASDAKNVLYVDRNGNGDLTDPDERIEGQMRQGSTFVSFSPQPAIYHWPHFDVANVVEQATGLEHWSLSVDVHWIQDYVNCSLSLSVTGRGLQSAGGDLMRLTDERQDAPIIHFNGPLTLRLAMRNGRTSIPIDYADHTPQERRRWYVDHPPEHEEDPLILGRNAKLSAQIGTPGLGGDTWASLDPGSALQNRKRIGGLDAATRQVMSASFIPDNVRPLAALTLLPNKPGRPAIKLRTVLDTRNGGTFTGAVDIPEDATTGKALVQLSFPDWTEGQVQSASSTVKLAQKQ
jgi:hypothetical protein